MFCFNTFCIQIVFSKIMDSPLRHVTRCNFRFFDTAASVEFRTTDGQSNNIMWNMHVSLVNEHMLFRNWLLPTLSKRFKLNILLAFLFWHFYLKHPVYILICKVFLVCWICHCSYVQLRVVLFSIRVHVIWKKASKFSIFDVSDDFALLLENVKWLHFSIQEKAFCHCIQHPRTGNNDFSIGGRVHYQPLKKLF